MAEDISASLVRRLKSNTIAPLCPPSARSISTNPKFQTLSGSALTLQEAPWTDSDGKGRREGGDENEKGDECEIRESYLEI